MLTGIFRFQDFDSFSINTKQLKAQAIILEGFWLDWTNTARYYICDNKKNSISSL